MAANSTTHCLTDRQMMLAVNGIERIFIGMIVPILILFGISGNILNLTVLLAPNMRTRSNVLLACLAVADCVFLIFMLPHSLAHYRTFVFSQWFRRLYLGNKMHLIAVLNWASATAMWLILVICLERLMGIKYPLSVRKHKRIFSPKYLVGFVVLTTGILTSYNHFAYTCATRYFCNGTQFHAMCLRSDSEWWFRNQTNPNSAFVKAIAHWGPHVNALFVVVLPIILVLVANVLLISTLRQRQNHFMTQQMSTKSQLNSAVVQSRTEHKVTITVCAIVTCFTITQGPSAVLTLLSEYKLIQHHEFIVAITSFTATLVVVGKALNFVLFCLSSKNFRSRLFMQTKRGIFRKPKRCMSVVTGTTTLDSPATMTTVTMSTMSSSPSSASRVATRTLRGGTSPRRSPCHEPLLTKQRTLSQCNEHMPMREFRRGMSVL